MIKVVRVECCPQVTRGIITCAWPPRNKGTDVSPSEDAIRATKGHIGSVWTELDEVDLDPEI